MPPGAHTKADWDSHAEEIRELLRNKTFKEVADYMAKERNFLATERQYKYRFGKEKHLTGEEWRWIYLEMQRRAAAGKQSHVYFNKNLQTADRVNRAMMRYGKRAHSEIDSHGMQNLSQKRISVRTPPALMLESNLHHSDALETNGEEIRVRETSLPHSTTEHTSEAPFVPGMGLGLEAGRQFNFESTLWTSKSPGFQCPTQDLSEFEAVSSQFEFPRTYNNEFALMPPMSPMSPGEMGHRGMNYGTSDIPDLYPMGRDENHFSVSNFVVHSRVKQWMANLPIFQVQYLLEQRAHILLQAHSLREFSPFATISALDNFPMEAGRWALTNLLGSATGIQLQDNFPQIVSRLENLVPEKEPNTLSKQLSDLLASRSISASGVWFLFGLGAYFSSNNLLDGYRTDTFLRWVIDQNLTEQLELFLDIKAPTIGSFSIKILESAIRAKNVELATTLLRRGVMLSKSIDEMAWMDDMELAKEILDRVDPGFYSKTTGPKALRRALQNNHIDLAQKLLDNGVSVDAKLNNMTQLYLAVSGGEVRNVRFLLECSADVNSLSYTYSEDKTALAAAVVRKHAEIVAILLDHHASVSCKVGSISLLDWASLKDRHMYNMLRKRVGDVGFNLGDLIFAAEEGNHSLKAYKRSHQERITTHQLEQALQGSIRLGNSAATVALLQSGVSPDGDTLRERPLETAIRSKQPFDICQLLINLGANVEVPGILRKVVGSRDSYQLLPLFVESKVNLDYQGSKALVTAARRGDIKSAIYLLARGVDVNTPDPEFTPLQSAAGDGQLEMVELLLSYNADIDAPAYPNDGRTALQAALDVEQGCTVAKLLLERGADVSAPPASTKGLTALEAACNGWFEEEEERRAMCHQLLDAGAPVHRPGGEASCVLHRIIQLGEDGILARFLEPRRNIDLEHMWDEPEYGWDEQEQQPKTPIQLAAECEHITQVKMLFHRGANINANPAPLFGRTALQAAASKGNKEIVEFLLANGAAINAEPAVYGGITALQGAAISGNVMLVALLLEKGACVNAEPSVLEGRYAIEGAAEHGRLDTVQLLLNAGAKGNVRSKKGFEFAITLAKKNGHNGIAVLLEEAEQKRLHAYVNDE